jgi:hypothetical protein
MNYHWQNYNKRIVCISLFMGTPLATHVKVKTGTIKTVTVKTLPPTRLVIRMLQLCCGFATPPGV